MDTFQMGVLLGLKRRGPAMQKMVGAAAGASVFVGVVGGTAPALAAAANEGALGPATGRAVYNGAGYVRAQIAGFRILSSSGVGAWFASFSEGLPTWAQTAGWGVLSWAWATGASGGVGVFPDTWSERSYLLKTELPIIMSNPRAWIIW